MDNLQSKKVGSYQSGAFIMRYYLRDFPYEHALFSPLFVGDEDINNIYSETKGGFSTTYRILTYLHEANHYMQDLSLSACMSDDYYHDEMAAFVHEAINMGCNSFPLFNSANKDYEWYPHLANNNALHNYIFDTSHINSRNPKYSSLFDEDIFKLVTNGNGLSYSDLLEGYVFYLSLTNLADRARISGKEEYLKGFKENSSIFPYKYSEENQYLDFTNAVTSNTYTYHVARLLFLLKNKGFNLVEAFKYCQCKWPIDYREEGNPQAFLDCAFFLLLDIALTIPAFAYIRDLCKEKYSIEDFSPVHRFLAELKVIEDNNGFPEIEENVPFYQTLFNFFSDKIGWLNFENTIESWNIYFERVDKPYSDTSMGYRRRMFWSKFSYFHKFIYLEPSIQMRRTNIPLVCVTNGGVVKVIKKFGNLDIPYEGLFDVFGMFKMKYSQWKEYGDTLQNSVEWVKIENENTESFIREIIYRIISRDLKDCILFEKGFTCSFYNNEYETAIKNNSGFDSKLPPTIHCKSMNKCKCCNIKNFSELPEHGCAVREYMKVMNYNIHNKHW